MNNDWILGILPRLIEHYVSEQNRPKLSDPNHHNLTWHEFSLMRHNALVVEAANRILELTGVDVVIAAFFHDLGKLSQFDNAIATGDYHFAGHEKLSFEIARNHGLDDVALNAILYHSISYEHRADRVYPSLCGGDLNKLIHLVALAACDTAGKGWTEAQREQRPQVAKKLVHICEMAEVDDAIVNVIERTCLEW
jgi:HD superfamily phosphodiesterase